MDKIKKYETSRTMLKRINEKRKMSANSKPMLFPIPNTVMDMTSSSLQKQLNKQLIMEPDLDKEIDRDYEVVSVGSEGKNSNIGRKLFQLKDMAVELGNDQENEKSLSLSQEISNLNQEEFNFTNYFKGHLQNQEDKLTQMNLKTSPFEQTKANSTFKIKICQMKKLSLKLCGIKDRSQLINLKEQVLGMKKKLQGIRKMAQKLKLQKTQSSKIKSNTKLNSINLKKWEGDNYVK